MTEQLLNISGLKTWLGSDVQPTRAVDGIDLSIHKGETVAILGESGCGKSMTALSVMQLVPMHVGKIVAGQVIFAQQDLLQLSEMQMRTLRGRRIAMIFQEPMTSLNAVLSIGYQIEEVLKQHLGMTGIKLRERVLELLDAVGIPDPVHRYNEYPHQLSGGMKQRVMIAIALAGEPELLIADEPTTAVDVTIQAQILELLRDLQQKTDMSLLLITHDLGVVAQMADRVAVMYAGHIVEQSPREQFFNDPQHPYTKKLFASLPQRNKRQQRLDVIKGSVPNLDKAFHGCRFADRCDAAFQDCYDAPPEWISTGTQRGVRCYLYDNNIQAPLERAEDNAVSEDPMVVDSTVTAPESEETPLLLAEDVKVHFPVKKGLFRHTVGYVYAVDGVDMQIQHGHTLALVGESGCGKTTMGKALLQLIRPTSGLVQFDQTELTQLRGEALRRIRSDIQIIFQDPYSSMDPRMMVGNILEEGMIALHIESSYTKRMQRIKKLLGLVGLPEDVVKRYPHEFSGGQRQRICIARALAVDPKLIVCDEPTSALDVSVQAQILNLLKSLQDELGLSYLFITHNLSVVEYLAHDVAIMYLGRIVEQGTVDEVFTQPRHPYTQALLSAVPVIDIKTKRQQIRLQGDIPSPMNPPKGCHFHPRCSYANAECKLDYPQTTHLSDTHVVKCYLYEDGKHSLLR